MVNSICSDLIIYKTNLLGQEIFELQQYQQPDDHVPLLWVLPPQSAHEGHLLNVHTFDHLMQAILVPTNYKQTN